MLFRKTIFKENRKREEKADNFSNFLSDPFHSKRKRDENLPLLSQ